jgi:hypothetical protein
VKKEKVGDNRGSNGFRRTPHERHKDSRSDQTVEIMSGSSPDLTSKEEEGGENEYRSTTKIYPYGNPEKVLPLDLTF